MNLKINNNGGALSLQVFLHRLIWLCILPLAVLAVFLAGLHIKAVQTGQDIEAADRVRNIATALDRDLKARIAALQVLAASPLVDEPIRLQEYSREAQSFRENFGGHVILADPDMQMLFNTRVALGTSLPKLPKPKGFAAAPAALATGKPAVGDMFIGPIAEVPLVAVVAPVIRNGRPKGLLLNIVETELFQQRLNEMALPAGWTLTLFDGSEQVMAQRAAPAMGNGTVGAADSKRFVAGSKISPWSMVLEIPSQVYRAPVITTSAALIAAILAVSLVSVLGGRLAGRSLARSVATLTKPADAGKSSVNIAEIETVRRLLDENEAAGLALGEELRQSEERFRLSTELANVAVWEYDCSANSMSRSKNHDRLYGLDWQSRWEIETFLAATHPDDREISHAIIQKSLAAGGPDSYTFDFRVVHPDSSVHWLAVVGQVAKRDAKGQGFLVRGCLMDVTERKRMETSLQESQQYNRTLFENSLTGLALCRMDGTLVDVNSAYAAIIGRTVDETLKLTYWEITPEQYAGQEALQLEALRTNGRYGPYEKEYIHKDGHFVPVRLQGRQIKQNGELCIWSSVEDITEFKRTEMILSSERRILEMISSGVALPEVLEQIVVSIESLSHETIASILLLDPDNIHVHYGAAPNLPAAYNEALEGESIGPRAGSCGTAAYRREMVIVRDIETDPLWTDYRELAMTHGLRACWSTPIINPAGKVLGTFAMYYQQQRSPETEELDLLKRATHIAGIAIEHKQVEERLRILTVELEERVRQRTLELEDKNEELEQFNKLFVDRELAMIELKERIKELEKEIASCKKG